MELSCPSCPTWKIHSPVISAYEQLTGISPATRDICNKATTNTWRTAITSRVMVISLSTCVDRLVNYCKSLSICLISSLTRYCPFLFWAVLELSSFTLLLHCLIDLLSVTCFVYRDKQIEHGHIFNSSYFRLFQVHIQNVLVHIHFVIEHLL